MGDDVPTVANPDYFADCFEAIQELVRRGWIMAGHDISAGGMITTLLEMCFANQYGGLHINLHDVQCDDIVKVLFAENPGVIIQVSDTHKFELRHYLEECGVGFAKIGYTSPKERPIEVKKDDYTCAMCGTRPPTCSTDARARTAAPASASPTTRTRPWR